MKKIIALGLAACLAVTCLVSCDDTPPVETTEGHVKKYDVEDGVLNSCIGQADENGVYTVPDTITMIGESAFAGDETLGNRNRAKCKSDRGGCVSILYFPEKGYDCRGG